MTALIDTTHLAPQDAVAALAEGSLALADGTVTAVVGPSHRVAAFLDERCGDAAPLVADLACIVYRRKGWFRTDLDPFALREHRPGQCEVRVFHTDADGVVPLLALDLAPVVASGTWGDLDQSTSNPAASVLEIARVAPGQPVRIEGRWRALDDVPLGPRTVWEASRLGAVSQLVRSAPSAAEQQHAAIRLAHDAVVRFAAMPRGERRVVQDRARVLFALTLTWAFHHLPVDLVVGLSQGDVVGDFVSGMPGGLGVHTVDLALDGWHREHVAFHYAEGYFATGAVKGYAIDAVSIRRDVRRGAMALARAGDEGTDEAAA